MRATDAILIELASIARVRPAHVFHFAAYRKAVGDKFTVEGYAAFAQMEKAHVERMVAAIPVDAAKPRRVREAANKRRLADDWTMPVEWLAIGRERRFWTDDVCRTEADKFANWHRMKGNAFADWKAAWRNWIDGSHREDGKVSAQPVSDADRLEGTRSTIRLYRRMGRNGEADDMARSIGELI